MDLPEIRSLRKTPDRIYIRAGLWSKTEPSMNWYRGEYERGTSVYPAKMLEHGSACLDFDDDYMVWHDYSEGLRDRLLWVVTGHEICKGTDGEPVLRCSSVVARPIPLCLSVRSDLVTDEL